MITHTKNNKLPEGGFQQPRSLVVNFLIKSVSKACLLVTQLGYEQRLQSDSSLVSRLQCIFRDEIRDVSFLKEN